jgi:magnesium chelatase family protein
MREDSMELFAHEPSGFEGCLVTVEVDIRRGIPGIDLVGLAAGAVREARERVRVSINNSGFRFPQDRVLINLAPSDLPKAGSAYDLPIALAILVQSMILPDPGKSVLALGELTLDGQVRPVRAVLPAIIAGLAAGIDDFVVPEANLEEAQSAGRGSVYPLARLDGAILAFASIRAGSKPSRVYAPTGDSRSDGVDFDEIRGHWAMKRALQVAAAGRHNVLLFGPPGSGKTMAAARFVDILPDLGEFEAMETASLRSLAGSFPAISLISRRPPLRSPHHSATLEGMTGGGKILKPGEISLAHRGVLFLDEAPEFHRDVLQALREPIEDGFISVTRAGYSEYFPARFQLILAANPCICGNLGRKGKICVCSSSDLRRYWKKLGGPLLDRIDIRIPLEPIDPANLFSDRSASTSSMRENVERAIAIQEMRYRDFSFKRNSELPLRFIQQYCSLDADLSDEFLLILERLGLSSRAIHSILKIARSISDLDGFDMISRDSLFEAVQYRRYGEADCYWP